MPKYKVDFRVVHIQGNKVKVKDNNGKLTWYHISDIKKTDMITKLICQLPDVNAFGRKGRLSFNHENVKDLGWVPNDCERYVVPDFWYNVKDILILICWDAFSGSYTISWLECFVIIM